MKKNIDNQIFQYFHYQAPSFLTKIVKHLNKSLVDLRNSINSEEIPENENPNKIIDIVEKVLDLINNKKAEDSKY